VARLPVPGSDENTWGDVLNDFLLQVHDADGTLKADVVGAAQLQNGSVSSAKLGAGAVGTTQLANNAVSTAKIQDGAVTAAKIADGTIGSSKLGTGVISSDAGLRSLLIFYAPPNIINGRFNDDYAAAILARYDDVVLGTGLEDPGSPYYASTTAIIQKVAALSPSTVIWGYIDCGVTTGNLPLSTLQTQIDQWMTIGAGGIFCDVIGYAYQVPRSRQNDIINYIHSKDVGAILNVFDPDEVLAPDVEPTYNPSGTATAANDTDVLLLESWVCNSDAYGTPHYTTFSDVKTRADAARAYRDSLGIRLFAANIIEHNSRTENQIKEYRDISEALARVWRLDGSGLAASTYSATGGDVGIAQPRYSSLRATPFRPDAPYILNGPWTEVEAPDLGLLVHYEAGTHTWTQL
jgi:hypothetical protein